MKTVIAPICKNKNGDINNASNYRPVSLAISTYKQFEHYILSYISPFLTPMATTWD